MPRTIARLATCAWLWTPLPAGLTSPATILLEEYEKEGGAGVPVIKMAG
jgi:hypothetical protein